MSPDPPKPGEMIGFLIGRLNHLEVLLVNNLLGFLLTTTFMLFAGIRSLREMPPRQLLATPGQVFLGASTLYLLLSGYYYFMLAQFYAAVTTLTPLVRNIPPASNLWSTLQTPSLGFLSGNMRNTLYLVNAPLLPLLFSIFTLSALWLILRRGLQKTGRSATDHGNQVRKRWLVLGITVQAVVAVTLIMSPFLRFLAVTVSATD